VISPPVRSVAAWLGLRSAFLFTALALTVAGLSIAAAVRSRALEHPRGVAAERAA
jgi:hypothetical protein